MAINKAMRAALKALSYPDPDIRKSYKMIRKVEKLTSRRVKGTKNCRISTVYVERDGYEIPVRIFEDASGVSRGVILFFHGGGWVNGDIDSYMNVCIGLNQGLARTIVSVDYRRAPEFKFPTAPEDCYAVAKKLFMGELLPEYLPDDIIIMGDSAGGNLAAVVSLMARDRGEFLPKRQILIYPSTGNNHSPESEFDSIRENGFDYLLTSKRIEGYMELYASDREDINNPYMAPLLAEKLQNQPATLVISAEYCPLRDEGEEYGRRLADAGNTVSVYRMPDAIHGYFTLPPDFKIVKKTYEVIKRFLGDDRLTDKQLHAWRKLDNAAKIFPPNTSKSDPKVFRFYCELDEKINERFLQSALDATMERFPFYRSILKKGIFWYYFEESSLVPEVRVEYREPCSKIYDENRKNLLFEVTYYKNRINLEVYHALTDGGGASVFFRTLVAFYLKRSHVHEIEEVSVPAYDATAGEISGDSFYKYYEKRKLPSATKVPRSYHIRGEKLESPRLGIIEGCMSVGRLLDKAHEYEATLTEFLVGVYIHSIADNMPLRYHDRSIIITVPVDLRQYFASKSGRNFFGIINVEYNLATGTGSLEDIISHVRVVMKESLQKEKLGERMSGLTKMENLLPARIIPIFIKNPGLRIANRVAERGVTGSFSNLGRLSMPPEFSTYIRKFGVMTSTNRIHACMCTFGDDFVVAFSSPYASTDVQCSFFRTLVRLGIETEITSNLGSDSNVIL